MLKDFQDVKEGDVLEVYATRKVERELAWRAWSRPASSPSCMIDLHFPDAGSLKAKRKELRPVKAHLRQRVGASVAEVGHQDRWQRATLLAALAAGSTRPLDEAADRLERLARRPLSAGRSRPARADLSPRPPWIGCAPTVMRRVDEAVRQVLSDAVATDLKDPRVGFVTVTAVRTSPDLRHARVYVSVLGDRSAREASLEGLRSAHGFLQRRVASELRSSTRRRSTSSTTTASSAGCACPS